MLQMGESHLIYQDIENLYSHYKKQYNGETTRQTAEKSSVTVAARTQLSTLNFSQTVNVCPEGTVYTWWPKTPHVDYLHI